MREIKFRAWSKIEKRMYPLWSVWHFENGVPVYEADDAILVQFTGLRDKNGKEIFEGDIVAAVPNSGWVEYVGFKGKTEDKERWLVKWDWDGFCWEALGDDKRYVSERDLFVMHKDAYRHEGVLLEEKEVIGNIYENPDLLSV